MVKVELEVLKTKKTSAKDTLSKKKQVQFSEPKKATETSRQQAIVEDEMIFENRAQVCSTPELDSPKSQPDFPDSKSAGDVKKNFLLGKLKEVLKQLETTKSQLATQESETLKLLGETIHLKEKIAQLESKDNDLVGKEKAENEIVLKTMNKKIADKDLEIKVLKSSQQEKMKKIENLTKELRDAGFENQGLTKRPRDASRDKGNSPEVGKLHLKVNQLEKELALAKSKAQKSSPDCEHDFETKQLTEQIESLKLQLKKMEDLNSAMKSEIVNLKNAETEEQNSFDGESLKIKISQLNREIQVKNNQIGVLANEANENQTKIKKLSNEKSQLHKELLETKVELKEQTEILAKTESNNQKLFEEIDYIRQNEDQKAPQNDYSDGKNMAINAYLEVELQKARQNVCSLLEKRDIGHFYDQDLDGLVNTLHEDFIRELEREKEISWHENQMLVRRLDNSEKLYDDATACKNILRRLLSKHNMAFSKSSSLEDLARKTEILTDGFKIQPQLPIQAQPIQKRGRSLTSFLKSSKEIKRSKSSGNFESSQVDIASSFMSPMSSENPYPSGGIFRDFTKLSSEQISMENKYENQQQEADEIKRNLVKILKILNKAPEYPKPALQMVKIIQSEVEHQHHNRNSQHQEEGNDRERKNSDDEAYAQELTKELNEIHSNLYALLHSAGFEPDPSVSSGRMSEIAKNKVNEKLTSLRKIAKEFEKDNRDLENENRQLRNEISELKMEKSSIGPMMKEPKSFNEEASESFTAPALFYLEDDDHKFNTVKKNKEAELQKQIFSLIDENTELLETKKHLRSEIKALKEQTKFSPGSRDNVEEKLRAKIANLQDELQSIKEQHDEGSNQNYANLEHQLKLERSKVTHLENELVKSSELTMNWTGISEDTRQMQRLERNSDIANAKLMGQNETIKRLQMEMGDMQKLERKVQQLEMENEILTSKLDENEGFADQMENPFETIRPRSRSMTSRKVKFDLHPNLTSSSIFSSQSLAKLKTETWPKGEIGDSSGAENEISLNINYQKLIDSLERKIKLQGSEIRQLQESKGGAGKLRPAIIRSLSIIDGPRISRTKNYHILDSATLLSQLENSVSDMIQHHEEESSGSSDMEQTELEIQAA